MKKIIEIHSITKKTTNLVVATIIIDNTIETITTEISDNMTEYILTDRCDAFVIGLLHLAISGGYSFKSDIPISEELYYNLVHHFIDALHDETKGMYKPEFDIPLISTYQKKGKIVATGISCGIDSLYTVATHSIEIPPSFKLTHLAFFDIGSHGNQDNQHSQNLAEGRYNICASFAKEYGYTFIYVKSDLCKILEKRGGYSHISNHTYMTGFCVLLLQSGINKYYYSAGHPYQDFRCRKVSVDEDFDASFYDLLTSQTISVNGMHFYSSGGAVSRIQKTKLLSHYPPAFRYLNVCVNNVHNDGTCFKCMRTLLGIDAVGNLDNFATVFDINAYKKNKKHYLQKMYIYGQWRGDMLLAEIIPFFRKELTFAFKLNALLKYLADNVKRICSKFFGK